MIAYKKCTLCFKLYERQHHSSCPFCNNGYISENDKKANEGER